MQVASSAVSHPIQRGRVPGPEENHFPAVSPHMTPSVCLLFFFFAFQREGLLERAGISSFMVVAKTKALLQAGNTPEKEVRCFSFTSGHWHLLSL